MATDGTDGRIELSLSAVARSVIDSYRHVGIPAGRYVGIVLVPAVGLFVLTLVLAVVLEMPLLVRAPLPLLGALAVLSAVFYPRIRLSQRKHELNNNFHLVVTHMTVLSTTKIDRMEVFRTLAKEEEYGALAEEMGRIVELVDTWNQSLDDACRRRAKEVPSDTLSDFLERLAYTIGAGQPLREYLLAEQEQIIQNHVTVYESSIDNLEVMKDLYLSMVLSLTFALVFAVVLPVLTGTDPTYTVATVILIYAFIQTGFFMAVRSVSPTDPVWFHPEEYPSAVAGRIRRSFYAGVGLSAVLFGLAVGSLLGAPVTLATVVPLAGEPLPLALYAAVPATPLLLPGLVLRRAENRIKGRDEEYPSFIRALGTTESVKQSTTSKVLESLRQKDFGPLTPNLDDLYKRLNMRVEAVDAWRYFMADTRSHLIQTFSEMYLIGREMGGDPRVLGELISENMNEILQLREQRQQATTTLIGLLYGITAASTFAFFIGLEVVSILSNMDIEFDTSAGFDAGQLIQTEAYNIPLIESLLVGVIVFSALLSAMMIRTVDNGHKINAYMHFVILLWLSALIAIITRNVVGVFLSV